MKKSHVSSYATAVLAVGMAVYAAPIAPAGAIDGSSSVHVLTPIEVGCFQDLNFGLINGPDGATGIWSLDVRHDDGTLTVMGRGTDSTDPNPNDHHPGLCLITGDPGELVHFTIAVETDFSAEGYNLLNMKTSPNSPAVLEEGELTVMVGGRLQVEGQGRAGVNGGGQPAIYRLTVDY